MAMTVAELIVALSEADQEAEVRVAHQPLQHSVGRVVDADRVYCQSVGLGIVWIGVGRDLGCLPGAVQSALGWR